jgi:hypothetical protein
MPSRPNIRLTPRHPILYANDALAVHQTLSVGSGAVVTTASITLAERTRQLVITVDTAAVRMTLDGQTSPTSAIGQALTAGTVFELTKAEFIAAKFITASGTAVLQITQEAD